MQTQHKHRIGLDKTKILLIVCILITIVLPISSTLLINQNKYANSQNLFDSRIGSTQEKSQISNNNFFVQKPSSSADSMNTVVFLSGFNQTHTIRGYNFTIFGYTQKLNNSNPPTYLSNAGNIPVFPVIDNIQYDGLNITGHGENRTIRSSPDGTFAFSINVTSNWDITQDLNVYANVTQILSEGIITGPNTVQNKTGSDYGIFHDITKLSQIDVSNALTEPVMPGDTYLMQYNLTDTQGNPIQTDNLTVYQNQNTTDVLSAYNGQVTNAQGVGSFTFTQLNGTFAVGLNFTGMGYTNNGGEIYYQIAPCNESIQINRVTSFDANLTYSNPVNSSYSYVFQGQTVSVSGTLWANGNSSYLLKNRAFQLYINDTVSVYNGATDETGQFSTIIDLTTIGHLSNTSFTFTIILLNLDATLPAGIELIHISNPVVIIGAAPVPSVNTEEIEQVKFDWTKVILPGIIVVVIVVGIILFQRYRMEHAMRQERKFRQVDYTRFSSINLLYNSKRSREAIAYTYKIFSDLINEKYGLMREPSQTLREFGIVCVTKYGLDPIATYSYLGMVENIIYGAFDINLQAFQKSMIIFGRVFQDITGTKLDFALETTTLGASTEVTLKIGAI